MVGAACDRGCLSPAVCYTRMMPTGSAISAIGIRTASEIQQERHALKALRGDYRAVPELPEQHDQPMLSQVSRAFDAAGSNSHGHAL